MNRRLLPLKIALLVACASSARAQTLPTPAPTTAPRVLAAPQYRAQLERALRTLEQVEKREPRDVRALLKPLDAPFAVKRDDGAQQNVSGDTWNRAGTVLGTNNPAKMTRPQTQALKSALQNHIGASRDWTTQRDGAYYRNVDAKKWLDLARVKRNVSTQPPFWQAWLSNALNALSNAVTAFFKWLSGFVPKTSTPTVRVGDPTWIKPLFYVCVAALLSFLLFLAIRSLQGKGLTFWRRGRTQNAELHDADAQLFFLPPDELMDRAARFASEGNFREALRHRFISLLVFLDHRGIWRYDVRRTNWEHIAQLRRAPQHEALVAPLSELTRSFDRVRYGNAPCDAREWDEFQNEAQTLENRAGGRKVEVARR